MRSIFISLVFLVAIAAAQTDNCGQDCEPLFNSCKGQCTVCYPSRYYCGPGCSPVDQSAMRRLVADWGGPPCPYWGDEGCLPPEWKNETWDVCQWPGVSCFNSSNSEPVAFVTQFSIPGDPYPNPPAGYTGLTGSFNAGNLPEGITGTVDLRYNQLSVLNLVGVPSGVTALLLNNNSFTGVVDFTKLNSGLQTLDLSNNKLTGPADLSNLPGSMQTLDLSNNRFSGVVQLSNLPVSMQTLDLSNNQFSGVPDLTKLPAYILTVDLRNNQFCGGSTLTPVTCSQLLLDSTVKCVFAYDGASLVTFPAC